MGIFKFLKKEEQLRFPEKKELEIPPAPPLKEILPSFSEEDIMAIKEAVGKPRQRIAPPMKTAFAAMEEAAVAAQRRLLGTREHLELTKPTFVNVEIFKDILNEIAMIQGRLKESSDSLTRLNEFAEDEGKELKRWQGDVQDVQKKLIYADKTLFG